MSRPNLREPAPRLRFDQLEETDFRQAYRAQGYLALEGMLSSGDIEALLREFRALLGRLADVQRGDGELIPASGPGVTEGARLQSRRSAAFAQFENGVEVCLDNLDTLDESVRKFMSYENESAFFRYLLNEHPAIRPLAEKILGEPVELYQSLALVKPARIGAAKAWHQDNAYFSVQDPSKMVGIWIALEEATPENGCMFVVEGGHEAGPLRHVVKGDCEIDRGRLDKSLAKPVPLPPGGGLVFHGNLPHFTPPNRSEKRRRAVQFHFRGASNKLIPKEAYAKVFVEADGSPATCAAAMERGI